MDNSSGVGVLDKSVLVLNALEHGPANLSALVALTGLPRPTTHRLASALVHHRLAARDRDGNFILGPKITELAGAMGEGRIVAMAGPILDQLRVRTKESSQLYQRQGDRRVCAAVSENPTGLRDTVPVGAHLSMRAGSAAQVLLAWESADDIRAGLSHSRFSSSSLARVRKNGWAQSVGERESGVASVSAPVYGPNKAVVAAISISGPIERLTRSPGKIYSRELTDAARELSEKLRLTAV